MRVDPQRVSHEQSQACLPQHPRRSDSRRLATGRGGHCVLEVADDGVGIPPDHDPVTVRSLGMRLIRSLVEQLHGQFDIRRTDPGTTARLSFSLKDSPTRSKP